jgi:hypothetical protein
MGTAQDFDLGGGFHYTGSYPMVFQHSGVCELSSLNMAPNAPSLARWINPDGASDPRERPSEFGLKGSA